MLQKGKKTVANRVKILYNGFRIAETYWAGLSSLAKITFGPEKFGHVYSYATMVAYIGSAVSYTAIGFSYDLLRTYVPAVYFCVLLSAVAVICVLRLRKKIL